MIRIEKMYTKRGRYWSVLLTIETAVSGAMILMIVTSPKKKFEAPQLNKIRKHSMLFDFV